ncbi:MAG: hypothetical protein AAB901_00615, partial [Patescibacteria group bacterium]
MTALSHGHRKEQGVAARGFMIGAVLLSLCAGFFTPFTVSAQSVPFTCPDGSVGSQNVKTGGTTCASSNGSVGTTNTTNASGDTTTTTVDTAGNVKTETKPDAAMNTNVGDIIVAALKNTMAGIIGTIAYVILIIASFVLWLIGGFFNWIVIRTVFEFGSYFGTSDAMLLSWGIMRDIGNIILLFGFIFMGLATILNTHSMDEFSARKALPRLIIFAVLLNFSLFASQIIIDASNGIASVFTAQAGLNCTSQEASSGADCSNVGIAGKVLQLSGTGGIWKAGDTFSQFAQNPQQQAPVFIGLAIFVTITGVVLLAGAIMLLTRAIVLMFLMITSPIGFAGMAIPQLQHLARDWWKTLFSQSFFAPVYLLLILISLKVGSGLTGGQIGGGESGGTLAAALINGGDLSPQIVVVFGVLIGLMVASLMIAKRIGAYGANFATNTAGKFVGGATFGTVGFVGRRTVGRASVYAGERVRQSSFGKTNLGRVVAGGFDAGGKASFDMRTTAPLKAGAKAGGIDLGKPNKDAGHGYHGLEEKAVKERTDYAKTLIGRDKNRGEIEAEASAEALTDEREQDKNKV